jgi:hypothetical protein
MKRYESKREIDYRSILSGPAKFDLALVPVVPVLVQTCTGGYLLTLLDFAEIVFPAFSTYPYELVGTRQCHTCVCMQMTGSYVCFWILLTQQYSYSYSYSYSPFDAFSIQEFCYQFLFA